MYVDNMKEFATVTPHEPPERARRLYELLEVEMEQVGFELSVAWGRTWKVTGKCMLAIHTEGSNVRVSTDGQGPWRGQKNLLKEAGKKRGQEKRYLEKTCTRNVD